MSGVSQSYLDIVRYLLPVTAVLFFLSLARSLLYTKKADKKTGKIKKEPGQGFCFIMLFLFQLLAMIEMVLFVSAENMLKTVICFGALLLITAVYTAVTSVILKESVGVELAAFFLSTLGFCVAASAEPAAQYKILIAALIGPVIFRIALFAVRKKAFIMKSRYVFIVLGMLLLLLTVIFGEVRNGAQNWIDLGFVTVQPSEFAKSLFILAAAGFFCRERNFRATAVLTGFTLVYAGMLVYMSDFGSVLLFFVTFIIVLVLSCKSLLYICTVLGGSALGGFVALTFVPYVSRRFSVWGKAFADANNHGYQQSRTLISILSGGLLGLGGGNGFLRKVVASDTDLVFGILCEEWGIIIGLVAALLVVLLFVHTVKRVPSASSPYYIIISVASSGLILFQTALNLFGSTDILPLTGVTFAFVSNGGTSIVACWIMLSLIKSTSVQKEEQL